MNDWTSKYFEMAIISKKRKAAEAKFDRDKHYPIEEAMALVKDVNTAKFDASVDLHINLGVDPRKADQAIRGTVTLPHGTGKSKSVLVSLKTPSALFTIISTVWLFSVNSILEIVSNA